MFTVLLIWFLNTLSDFVFASLSVCSCLVLCSLAEEEIKTESDVVEGMNASARSKGKSLRPSTSHSDLKMSDVLVSEKVELIYCKCQEQDNAFCWFLRTAKIIHYAWLPACLEFVK